MALYIGVNYHPHDWDEERWKTDIDLMKKAGFTTVRLGHLCWDSYEPEEGVYTFEWFDKVMDLFAEAEIGVVLDVSLRPAPGWVHKLCPGCNIGGKSGKDLAPLRRYMEDMSDPAYQKYALRFAETLVKRYAEHPALFAFGLCNEIGDGYRSLSEISRQRWIQWLKKKYGTIEKLNEAWAARRWSRKLNSFDDAVFPENEAVPGAPEPFLDMRRFFSDGMGEFLVQLQETVKKYAPCIPTSSNHYAEKNTMGFDYLKYHDRFVEFPGMGFYPGFQVGEKYHSLNSTYIQRIAETGRPMWCLEFQTGGQGHQHGPWGTLRMMAMLCLMNRSQMILGWTWRTMLAGEEQYLNGLLEHDGFPNVNYGEYVRIAEDMKKLEKYGFPYLPVPDIGVTYSYDNDWVIQYAGQHYRKSYLENMTEVEKVFFRLNRDYNVVNLRDRKHDYKLLIVPEHVLMSPQEADDLRRYVADGGYVIMTAYSATVDEHNQAFAVPRPGRLEDVFGIRVAGYERTDAPWNKQQEGLAVADFRIQADYYENLELCGAQSYADFTERGGCAVSVNRYGKGKAYYTAPETNDELLKWLIEKLTEELGLEPGLQVPEGVQARRIAPNQYFYINTTEQATEISLPSPGYCVLGDYQAREVLHLAGYDAELVVTMGDE